MDFVFIHMKMSDHGLRQTFILTGIQNEWLFKHGHKQGQREPGDQIQVDGVWTDLH